MRKVLNRRVLAEGSDGLKIQAICVVVRDYIRRHCREGNALVSMRQLAKELGVGLPAVHWALRQLAFAGLVEVNHGERTRVTAAALRAQGGVLENGRRIGAAVA